MGSPTSFVLGSIGTTAPSGPPGPMVHSTSSPTTGRMKSGNLATTRSLVGSIRIRTGRWNSFDTHTLSNPHTSSSGPSPTPIVATTRFAAGSILITERSTVFDTQTDPSHHTIPPG